MGEFKINESDFQKLLKVYNSDKNSLENATDAYLLNVPAVCLDSNYKIFYMTQKAEEKTGYSLKASKLCGLTAPKRRLDDVLKSAKEKGEEIIDYIPELIIPTRNHLFLHLKPQIRLVEQGAIVLIKKAFKKDPKSLFDKFFKRRYEKDVYIEAGSLIDFENPESKKRTAEIHAAYINNYINDLSREVIVDLSYTEKISDDCLAGFSYWARAMKNFYLAYPSEEIYSQLDNDKIKFPLENIIIGENQTDSERKHSPNSKTPPIRKQVSLAEEIEIIPAPI